MRRKENLASSPAAVFARLPQVVGGNRCAFRDVCSRNQDHFGLGDIAPRIGTAINAKNLLRRRSRGRQRTRTRRASHPCAGLPHRHRTVRSAQRHRAIHQFAPQRGAETSRLAEFNCDRLPEFSTVGVIIHEMRIFIAVRQYLAGRENHGEPHALLTLQRVLSDKTMAKLLRTYATRYRFAHPTAADFQKVATQVSGQDLAWFFGDPQQKTGLLYGDAIDSILNYKAVSIKGSEITVARFGTIIIPTEIQVIYTDDATIQSAHSQMSGCG